jgi:hypothetical protein
MWLAFLLLASGAWAVDQGCAARFEKSVRAERELSATYETHRGSVEGKEFVAFVRRDRKGKVPASDEMKRHLVTAARIADESLLDADCERRPEYVMMILPGKVSYLIQSRELLAIRSLKGNEKVWRSNVLLRSEVADVSR